MKNGGMLCRDNFPGFTTVKVMEVIMGLHLLIIILYHQLFAHRGTKASQTLVVGDIALPSSCRRSGLP